MRISGLQKLTLLDFPGRTACTVFTSGCNLRCPFCHNSDLVLSPSSDSDFTEDDVFSLLTKRKGLLDGVCITGGEPMLMKDLPEFCQRIKDLGFAVKIDTNGFYPEQLKYIVKNGLCDYVAMDVKNVPEKYAQTVGLKEVDISRPLESIEFLKGSSVDHEFRTTVCRELHTVEDLKGIASLLGEDQKYFLQCFVDSGALIGSGITGYLPSELNEMLQEVRKIAPLTALRGVNQ